ncbi:MAG: 3-hydroxyacyl-CoA dehydrogenase, partial [Gammaproteobacteria bacterium]|nr:3-hydroxyacyl-CoA dehydrogenase [Gammaproteobacteria bacterium]
MIEEGVPAVQIDAAAVNFGMPMGPVALADSVGLDICLSVAENLAQTVHVSVPAGLRQLVADGHLGVKSGRGYYQYRRGRPVKSAADTATSGKVDLEDRLVLRLINECVACLRERIVGDPDLVDAAMVFGTGFAPFRGGPMQYAPALEVQYGDRYKPDPGWAVLTGTDV